MTKIEFFDDSMVPARSNVERHVWPPRKHRANPLLEPQMPWEEKRVCFEWPTVLYDAEERIFKAWYEAHADGKSFGCYAVSRDGIRWERPSLGLFSFRGSKKNNICYRGVYLKIKPKCINVIKRAPGDYHLYIWDSLKPAGAPGVIHSLSADGIHWRLGRKNPVVQTPVDRTLSGGVEDVLRVSYDPPERRFLLSMRTLPFENLERPLLQKTVPGGLWQRRVSIAASTDGETFTRMRTVLVPSLNDPWDVQFYALSPFRFADRYLGYLQTFRPGRQVIDVELACSADGESWQRVAPNVRYIPTGRPPACDCGLIHPISAPVSVDEKLYIYYWGCTSNHAGGTIANAPLRNALCLAVADAERIVSVRALEHQGSVLLGPVTVAGLPRRQPITLAVNADASKGEVRCALRRPDTFEEIPGFTADAATPISSDVRRHAVSWRGASDLSPLRGAEVLIHVLMRQADLFSVTVG